MAEKRKMYVGRSYKFSTKFQVYKDKWLLCIISISNLTHYLTKKIKGRKEKNIIHVNFSSNIIRSESDNPTTKPKNRKHEPQSSQSDIQSGDAMEEKETIDFDSPVAFRILQHKDLIPKKRKNDLPKFIEYLKERILKEAIEAIERPGVGSFKIWAELEIVYYKPTEPEKPNPPSYLRSKAMCIYNNFELEDNIEDVGE